MRGWQDHLESEDLSLRPRSHDGRREITSENCFPPSPRLHGICAPTLIHLHTSALIMNIKRKKRAIEEDTTSTSEHVNTHTHTLIDNFKK